MDAPRAAVRLLVLAVAGLFVALVVLSVAQEGKGAHAAVTARDGSPFALPRAEGSYEALWVGEPVLVVVTRQAILDGVTAVRGPGEATDAIPLGDGLAVFVTSARSNFLGCTGKINTGLGASKDVADYDGDGRPDGRFLDACHQGQWDVFHRGAPVPGTPTEGPLAQLKIDVDGDQIRGHGFTGPVGGQHRA